MQAKLDVKNPFGSAFVIWSEKWYTIGRQEQIF
jgi:hypothetical protein